MNPGELRHRITFQRLNDSEEWIDYYNCYAKVNTEGGREYLGSSAEQSVSNTVFTIRYCKMLKDLYLNSQLYRIKFNKAVFDIKFVDNYMFKNQYLNIKAIGRASR